MKQIGNLAIVCARRKDVTLRIEQGRVMVKDIELANAMIDRMATLSNLIEKEQSRISS